MPHATPLPIAEKAKAAIARQEAIERKCAQAIENFDLDRSPECEQAVITVAKDIVAAFAIGTNQIDLAAFDPFVTMHSVSEGDPGKMDTVVRLFAGIADEHGASIELNHHVRKPAAGAEADHDVFDIRCWQLPTPCAPPASSTA
jgi:hypothetical protein